MIQVIIDAMYVDTDLLLINNGWLVNAKKVTVTIKNLSETLRTQEFSFSSFSSCKVRSFQIAFS